MDQEPPVVQLSSLRNQAQQKKVPNLLTSVSKRDFQSKKFPAFPNTKILRASSSGVDSIKAWATYFAAYPELFDANGNAPYKAYPNNVKDGFQTGQLYENSVSISGGDANSSINLTASNVDHKGYVINSSYVRNNISVGAQTRYKWITVGGNLSYAKS